MQDRAFEVCLYTISTMVSKLLLFDYRCTLLLSVFNYVLIVWMLFYLLLCIWKDRIKAFYINKKLGKGEKLQM